jgi:Uncharacterized protein conserved in bacteria
MIKQGIYRHFKGNEYDVIGEAVHSETGERFVLYRPKHGNRALTVRPLAMFTEHVDRPEIGYSGPRFYLILANQEGPI